MAPPATLIGRDAELDVLARLAAGIGVGGGSLLVRGAAGVGKSSLLHAAGVAWAAEGHRVLRTDGVLSERRLAFAALHKLLRPVLGRTDELAPGHRTALATVFGLIDGPAPEVYRVALAALELLADVASAGPLLLVVEDTQWLDSSSADVLAFIARRLDSDPILLLASAREADEDAATLGTLPELVLGPLDPRSARELLDEVTPELSPATRRTVLASAAGNPLALTELPKALAHARVGVGPTARLPVTDRLEQAFAARLRDLPPATNDLLLLAAANDSDHIGEVLDAARRLPECDAELADFHAALDAGFVEIQSTALRFRHPLMRSSIYQAATVSRRHAAHEALAAVLGDHADRRAWHGSAAVLGADETVAADLEAVARRAVRRGAIGDAVAALERAAALSPDLARGAARALDAAELSVGLAGAAVTARLLDAVGSIDLDGRDRLRAEWVREVSGHTSVDGVERVEALIALADRSRALGETDLGMRLLVRAGLRCWRTDLGTAIEARLTAATDAMPVDELDPRRIVLRAYSSPLVRSREVIELVRRPGAVRGVDPAGLHLLGHAAACVGAFREDEELCVAAANGLREQGRLGALAQVLRLLAFATLRRSRWDVSAHAAEESARLAEETRQPDVRADALAAQAWLAALRHDLDAAERLGAEASALAQAIGHSITMGLIQTGRAAMLDASGQPEVAFRLLLQVFRPEHPAHQRMQAAWSIGILAAYAAESGCEEEARAELARLEPLVAGTTSPGVLIAVRHARARLAGARDAEALYVAALAPDLGPWPFEHARTQLAFGTWLRRQKRIRDSREPLRAARETFDRLGAVGWAERARQELRAAGESSSRRAPEAWDQLTAQEVQIAQLVALGLSNKEIGAKLFLSHRTVGSHLYRMFPKLGVTSRAQLARSAGAREAS